MSKDENILRVPKAWEKYSLKKKSKLVAKAASTLVELLRELSNDYDYESQHLLEKNPDKAESYDEISMVLNNAADLLEDEAQNLTERFEE